MSSSQGPGSDHASRFLRVAKVIVTAAAVCGAAYVAYKYLCAEENKTTANGEGKRADVSATGVEDRKKAKKQINFETASREQTLELLRDIVEVNKQLNVLMEKATAQVIRDNLNLHETYTLLKRQLPPDPLEKNGVSISDFDKLLARFEKDSEVQNLVVEVIQAGGPESATIAPSDEGKFTEKDKAYQLTPDTIVAINGAMRDRLREIADELEQAADTLDGGLHARASSLTAQALVGAYVQREYGYTAEDVERAMNVHTYELTRREDFLAINDEIGKTMQRFLTPVVEK